MKKSSKLKYQKSRINVKKIKINRLQLFDERTYESLNSFPDSDIGKNLLAGSACSGYCN